VTRGWAGFGESVPNRRTVLFFVLTASLTVAVFSLVWLAYRAVGEWRRSTILLVNQRSEEALTLLTVALSRDMKGVHDSVLASFNESALDLDRPFELQDLFAQAFARFPYPESFFVWRDMPGGKDSSFVFNRVDRPPAWAAEHRSEDAFPVVLLRDTPIGRELVTQATILGQSRRKFGAFETTLSGVRYQVVVHLLYHTLEDRRLFGAVGFTVNMAWVRDHYFEDILRQISAIGDVEDTISLSVSDDAGNIVASTKAGPGTRDVLHARRFPLSFVDSDLVSNAEQASMPAPPDWTASVSAADDRTVAAAVRGSARTLWLVLAAAAAVMMGLVFTLRALNASAKLADMQSEFISSATHELKTPLAVFQLVAETLAKGRYHSGETIRTYAGLLSDHTHLLERLIDNLLAYASLSNVRQPYAFQSLSVADLVETALERFDARLAATGTEVKVDVSPTLPTVRGDRQTLLQVFDNVIDNAIKYAPDSEALTIKGYANHNQVHVEITDRGVGIPVDERERVFQKFYRGSRATVGGSGLGLAIARRVVHDHRGRIEIRTAAPQGTTVDIALPAEAAEGQAVAQTPL
jgi:signal transduction histidine kinase